ncbi:glycosyltransferase family 39 protein [Solirubrobacter phytolaccae]|uniref:Glycosyltransferase family 39 protein n=1 Tax=Solirubrobacter phytolaccae TaxID=1404360 RepID=A0A9X3NL77_9ACTN|nr:glycosyltransferase family 39 protein [Solirubrobacter phytolaccae]MDA0183522.1 glycosyltransferase family 39 protein [Solirubrobacter phytolaccae]
MSRFSRRVELAATVLALAAAVLVWALTRTYPNYDSYYHLVWGRELLGGSLPSFEAYAAPTQHPLYIAVAALLGLVFGESGDRALVLLCFLAHAAMVLGTYRLGAAVFGRWSGALAALFVAASASFLLYAARGYVDPPFLALVIWAGVLAAEDRRGVPVLLVLAGLLRPEAWVLTGLWAVGDWWRGRTSPSGESSKRREAAGRVVAVFIAPGLWALTDLIVTGNAAHSIQATSTLAEELGRVRGIQHVPGSFVTFIGSTVRPPVALLAPIGAYLAWRFIGWRRLLVPAALLAGGIITFVGTGILGLSILPRYLTVPAIAMCLFAGYALLGFTEAEGRVRALWLRTSAGAAVVGAIGMLILAPSLTNVTEEMRFIRATHDSLVALLDDPEVQAGLECGPLTFPTYRLVPDAKWHLEDARIGARSAKRRDRGVEVFALSQKGLRRYGFADGTNPAVNLPNPAFERVASAGILTAYRRC